LRGRKAATAHTLSFLFVRASVLEARRSFRLNDRQRAQRVAYRR
jgi:hypothetical protein